MIRLATKKDIAEINRLGSLLHEDFSRLFHIETEIKSQFAIVLVSVNNNEIDGFLYALDFLDNLDLLSIVVDERKRGKRIGSNLLETLINMASSHNQSITLEVSVANLPAVSLYKKYDFLVETIRKNYYNGIDAYLMRRK